MALPATDAFTGTNGTALTTYSANWTYNKGTFGIHTNALCCTVDGFDAAAHWNADTFGNDQYARATVTAIDSLAYVGVAVRCHASAETWYEVIGNNPKSKNNAFDVSNWNPQIKWTNVPVNKTIKKAEDITALRQISIVLKDEGTKPGRLNYKI